MSNPDFFASTKASAIPASVATPINWLAIFVVCPEPTGPMCETSPPRTFKTGSVRSNISALPPTRIDRVPASAPPTPPVTGASMKLTPLPSSSPAIFLPISGSIVLMSITTEPFLTPSMIPAGPVIAASTC